jgi:two-component system response regulator AtoC
MKEKDTYPSVLVCDDDLIIQQVVSHILNSNNIHHEVYGDGGKLISALSEDTRVCLLDLSLPGTSGLDCLRKIKAVSPNAEVIIITKNNEASIAFESKSLGAFDYITKPIDPSLLLKSIRRALLVTNTKTENTNLLNSFREPNAFNGSSSPQSSYFDVRDGYISKLINRKDTILLLGESGTGKTTLSRIIHSLSSRSSSPFISVSCPTLPGNLLESEMFGHEKGAFTGADTKRIGRAELAHGGTLFLDEIGDIQLSFQTKLLTFIQDQKFYRIGGQRELFSDVRIIAATNKDLRKLVDEGLFREDLFYRLNVFPVTLPPLRERLEFLPELVEHILLDLHKEQDGNPPVVASGVFNFLKSYHWPGNIRELENMLNRAYVLREDKQYITKEDFRMDFTDSYFQKEAPNFCDMNQSGLTLEEIEKRAIWKTLLETNNNKTKTAEILGIALKSVHNKVKKYNINLDM